MLLTIAMMLAVIACAWVSYHLVEKPCRNLSRAWIARRAGVRSATASGFDQPVESIAVSAKPWVAGRALRTGAATISSPGQDGPT